MVGTYDLWLVLLSVIVAINASFVALDLASRIEAARSTAAEWYSIGGGAVAMGLGIWSMHFIGMLALRLPIPMSYDVWITLASLLTAVVASAVALFVASRGTLSLARLPGAGMLMGVGIASMHYLGMAAMRMQPPIEYSGLLVGLSIVVAIAASVATVWSAFVLRMETIVTAFWKKAGSAIVMSAGICGMHYLGMAAARFAPNGICAVAPQHIDNAVLGTALGGFTLLFLVATLLVCAYDGYFSAALKSKVAERTAALQEAHAELRRLLRRLTDAQDEERRRTAAELHDIVGQNIAALSAEISLIRDRIGRAAGPELTERLSDASALASQAVKAVRTVMAQLRPPGLDELGLPVALRWHADAFESRTGVAVMLTVNEALPRPATAVEESVLRVTAEALSNAAKHAAARTVRVRLEGQGVTGVPWSEIQRDAAVKCTRFAARGGYIEAVIPHGLFGLARSIHSWREAEI